VRISENGIFNDESGSDSNVSECLFKLSFSLFLEFQVSPYLGSAFFTKLGDSTEGLMMASVTYFFVLIHGISALGLKVFRQPPRPCFYIPLRPRVCKVVFHTGKIPAFHRKIYRLLIGKELLKKTKLVVRKDVFEAQSLALLAHEHPLPRATTARHHGAPPRRACVAGSEVFLGLRCQLSPRGQWGQGGNIGGTGGESKPWETLRAKPVRPN